MSKYIIKNCPSYCYLGKECHNEEGQYGASCCEITDCVIKQIVEECKNMKQNTLNIILRVFVGAILQRLDIQEVE